MNPELKKPVLDKKYSAKYMQRHQTLCVTLDKEEDADIINWLKKQHNRSQSVREILRRIAKNDAKRKVD